MKISGFSQVKNIPALMKKKIKQSELINELQSDEVKISAKNVAKKIKPKKTLITAIISAVGITAAGLGISSCSYNKGVNDAALATEQILKDTEGKENTSVFINDVDGDGAKDIVISNSNGDGRTLTVYHINTNEKFQSTRDANGKDTTEFSPIVEK